MSITKALSPLVTFAIHAAVLAQAGTIDPTFNNGSPIVVTDGAWGPNASGGGFGTLNRVVIQSTGQAVVLGHCNNPQGGGFGAVRFRGSGSADH